MIQKDDEKVFLVSLRAKRSNLAFLAGQCQDCFVAKTLLAMTIRAFFSALLRIYAVHISERVQRGRILTLQSRSLSKDR